MRSTIAGCAMLLLVFPAATRGAEPDFEVLFSGNGRIQSFAYLQVGTDNLVDTVPMLGYIMTKDMSPKQLGYLQEFADFGQQIGVVPEKIDVKQDLKSF